MTEKMSHYLPLQVWMEILLRLPVKAILRFVSVCKAWYDLIHSPTFITCHLNLTVSNPRFLVHKFDIMDMTNKYYLSIDTNRFKHWDELKFPFHPYKNCYFTIIGTCNGLVCVLDNRHECQDFFLWNPSIQKYVQLPRPNIAKYPTLQRFYCCNTGFGFNTVTNNYNIVRIVYFMDHRLERWLPPKVEIYELSVGTWRCVNVDEFSHVIKEETRQIVVNSVIHWIGRDHNIIVFFDLKKETFGVMKVPTMVKSGCCDHITQFGESLSIIEREVRSNIKYSYFYIWVMEEYGVEKSWTRHFKIDYALLGFPYFGVKKSDDVVLVNTYHPNLGFLSHNFKTRKSMELGLIGSPFGHPSYVASYMESLVLLIEGKS